MPPPVPFPTPTHWVPLVLCWLVCLAGGESRALASDLRRQADADGVEYSAELSRDRVELSQTFTLTLAIRKPIDIAIEPPDAAPAMSEFWIRDFARPLPTLDGQVEQIQLVYTLEPKQIGTVQLILPGLVYWLPGLEHTDENARLIEVDPLQLVIDSKLVTTEVSLDQLLPPPGPIAHTPHNPTGLWAAITGLILLGSVASWWFWSKRALRTASPVSPQELARRQLYQLVESRLAQADQKQFFVQLTSIVRGYIEASSGVRAPELTTEEFLQAIGQHRSFSDERRASLREFLEAADLVKFAGARMGSEAITAAVQRADDFVSMDMAPMDASQAVDSTNDRPVPR